MQINLSVPGLQNKHCTVTVRGRAETLPGKPAGKLAVREPSETRGSNLYHTLGWLRGWGQGLFSSASFLIKKPSWKAHGWCDWSSCWLAAALATDFPRRGGQSPFPARPALFLHADQHRHSCECRLLLLHHRQQHPGEDASQGLCRGWWGTQAPRPAQGAGRGAAVAPGHLSAAQATGHCPVLEGSGLN